MSSSAITNINIKTYDEALLSKFRSRVPLGRNGKPVINVIYAPTNLAFEYAMKRQKVASDRRTPISIDKDNTMILPMISIFRGSTLNFSDMSHEVLSHKQSAFYVAYLDGEEIKGRNIQRLFVDIPYQMDIWTDTEEDAVEILQSMLFLLKREQVLQVKQLLSDIILPDGTSKDIDYDLKITLDNQIIDNTSLEDEPNIGKLYRFTLTFTIEDAILVRDTKLPLITTSEVITDYNDYGDHIALSVKQTIEED